MPWGISESGYNKTDAHLNYQYRAFGVPGLGFKRGLGEDLVVAPYASVMALMVEPAAACANIRTLMRAGVAGEYGLYEAVDYTASRLPPGKTSVIVRSFMSHHQGMAFLSLAYVLRDRPMQRRFDAEPAFQATALLLQEKVPRLQTVEPHAAESSTMSARQGDTEGNLRVFSTANRRRPRCRRAARSRRRRARPRRAPRPTTSAAGPSPGSRAAVRRPRPAGLSCPAPAARRAGTSRAGRAHRPGPARPRRPSCRRSRAGTAPAAPA